MEIKGELFPFGGPGRFILSPAEALCPALTGQYAGKVNLIYLDPPFGTGEAFCVKAGRQKLAVPVYRDDLGRDEYLAMMRTVLTGCHELLAKDGSLYLHVDYRMSAHMRLMLDDIFGEANFVNEIIWAYKSGGRSMRHYSRKHDVIFLYRKSPASYFNIAAVGVPRGPEKRNNMKRGVDGDGRVFFSIRSGGKLYKYYEDTPIFPSDVWDDIEHMHQRDPERTGFATQKPASLLRRVILASSREGDLVADFFSGSGTTAAVASALGRRFIVSDISPAAMAMLRRRQLAAHRESSLVRESDEMRIEYPSLPSAQISARFTVERGERLSVRVDSFSGPYGFAYFAIGRVDGEGLFRPASYTLVPAEGAVLTGPLSCTHIEICDHSGGGQFHKIDSISPA